MVDNALDAAIRRAAFDHLRTLSSGRDYITSEELARGFEFNGERIPLVNPRRGIFKPRQMKYLLSIRTVFPRPGNKVWYDDQRKVHQALYHSEEFVDYAFMGQDPESADNRWLREASEAKVPIVYLIGGRLGASSQLFLATLLNGTSNVSLPKLASASHRST